MKTNDLRSILYLAARLLGWVQAGHKAAKVGSPAPILKRAGRVYAGRAAGSLINRLFR